MTLRDYLDREGLTLAAFAKRIGTDHARTVERYAKGLTIPDRQMMPRIVDATGGQVTPNDFFGVVTADTSVVAA
jgi:transcriptional regulator with XRE-family HTH domain